MNVRAVAIPDRMQHLPRDRRGFPIFYAAFVDSEGRAYFTINDEEKRLLMVRNDLCSICGNRLFRGRWFCGGPLSAFEEMGCYSDMPMHDECVHYALKVCPYLALRNYAREVGQRQADTIKAGIVTVDETMIPDRPEVFVAVMAIGQTMVGQRATGESYVKPNRPYRKVEYWQHGRQLPDEEGEQIARDTMQRQLANSERWHKETKVFRP